MKVLVAYDGTLQSKDALRYGMEKVREHGGEVLALHVFNSSMFIDYEVSPGAVDVARREFASHMEDAKLLIREEGNGVRAGIFAGEGDPEDEVIQFAKERNVDLLLCPHRYKSVIKRFKRMAEERGRAARENAILDKTEKFRMAEVSIQ
jgi:nucleotide-binding universal stress UspA family protein